MHLRSREIAHPGAGRGAGGWSASHLIMAADKRTEIQVAPGPAHLLRIVGGAKNDRRSKSGFGWHIPVTQWRFLYREVGPLQQLPGGHKVLYGYAVSQKAGSPAGTSPRSTAPSAEYATITTLDLPRSKTRSAHR